jgi:hypothetical protein
MARITNAVLNMATTHVDLERDEAALSSLESCSASEFAAEMSSVNIRSPFESLMQR